MEPEPDRAAVRASAPIGQREECRLWNLVATNTREATSSRRCWPRSSSSGRPAGAKSLTCSGGVRRNAAAELLKEAIRHGELPETRARMHQVIDASAGDGVEELIRERALAADHLTQADLDHIKAAMDEARARRLQPHYIEMAFKAAFTRLGGRIARRERGRYEISNVPASLRHGRFAPIAARYERVTFDLAHVEPDGLSRADLLAPGLLHDAVMAGILTARPPYAGTVLVSADLDEPHLLVGVIEEVADATGRASPDASGMRWSTPDQVTLAGQPPIWTVSRPPRARSWTRPATFPGWPMLRSAR